MRAGGEGSNRDEMVGWHHHLRGHEFEHVSRDSEGQGGLVCCDSWGRKESDITEQVNNNTNLARARVNISEHMEPYNVLK